MSKFYDEIEIDFIILLLPSYFSVLYVGIYVWQNCIYMYNHRIHVLLAQSAIYSCMVINLLYRLHLLMSRTSLQSPTCKKLKSI